MKDILTIVCLFIGLTMTNAQSITNGNFTSGGSSWGCSPETNPESVYGGNGSNRVAEVDSQAKLCQTISGFTIGNTYEITFLVSRRTSCGPSIQTMEFSIDGGALSNRNISRSGAFNFTPETFNFTATSTSHTIYFNGTVSGTCGLIVDNIVLSAILPVELVDFDAKLKNDKVELSWNTASEINNDFFTVLRSAEGDQWETISEIEGANNSAQLLSYTAMDQYPLHGINYYKLMQTDFDGQTSFSSVITINYKKEERLLIYPNPTTDFINISNINPLSGSIEVYDIYGNLVLQINKNKDQKSSVSIDISNLPNGTYVAIYNGIVERFSKR